MLVTYLILAYSITWLLLSPLVLNGLHITNLVLPSGWNGLGALCPLLGALLVIAASSGREGIQHLLTSMGRWRVGLGWSIFGALNPLLLFVPSAVLIRLYGLSWPDFGRLATPAPGTWVWVVDGLLASMVYGIGEEPGWRGFVSSSRWQRMQGEASRFQNING